jgi:hypothetical protein
VTSSIAETLLEVARLCVTTLARRDDDDWTVQAGELEWTCRTTLEHLSLLAYGQQLALRSLDFEPIGLTVRTEAPIAQVLWTIEVAVQVLSEIANAAPVSARGYHPAGLSDADGFLAMETDELLIHTHDICSGFKVAFAPPDELVVPILDRLFPWWPQDTDPWQALLWANGRCSLPHQSNLGSAWLWHCAPLSEWDGTIPVWDPQVDRLMVT